MMKSIKTKSGLVVGATVESKQGAAFKVVRLNLSTAGNEMLTSKSTGITTGARTRNADQAKTKDHQATPA